MATIKLSPLIERLSGKVGDLVFRTYRNRVVLSARPRPSRTPPSQAQLAQRARFREATLYARRALEAPEARAFYEGLAEQRGKPVNSIAIADFLNPPSVTEVEIEQFRGEAGDPIWVEASDDAGVVDVLVAIEAGSGDVLESGQATLEQGRWCYRAQTRTPRGEVLWIRVRASDRPGNVAKAEREVRVPWDES